MSNPEKLDIHQYSIDALMIDISFLKEMIASLNPSIQEELVEIEYKKAIIKKMEGCPEKYVVDVIKDQIDREIRNMWIWEDFVRNQ